MEGFIGIVLGFLSGFFKTATKVLELIKAKQFRDQGRQAEQAEQAKQEVQITREQTEIILEDRKREDTVKKLEDGTF
jgi:hypothetical protein